MANLHGEDLLQKGLPRTSLTPCSLAGRYVTCWWPPPAGTATSPWPASSSLCWTRRTGCWTWASCPTSAAASPTPRCPGRRSVRLSVFSATFPSRSSSLPGNSYTIISSLSSARCPLLSALCSLLYALCSLLSALCSLLSALCSQLSVCYLKPSVASSFPNVAP